MKNVLATISAALLTASAGAQVRPTATDPPRPSTDADPRDNPCVLWYGHQKCRIEVAVELPTTTSACRAKSVDQDPINVYGRRSGWLVWVLIQPNPGLGYRQFRFRPPTLGLPNHWPIDIVNATASHFEEVESDEGGDITDHNQAIGRVRRKVVNDDPTRFTYNIAVDYREKRTDPWTPCDTLDPVIISRG